MKNVWTVFWAIQPRQDVPFVDSTTQISIDTCYSHQKVISISILGLDFST